MSERFIPSFPPDSDGVSAIEPKRAIAIPLGVLSVRTSVARRAGRSYENRRHQSSARETYCAAAAR